MNYSDNNLHFCKRSIVFDEEPPAALCIAAFKAKNGSWAANKDGELNKFPGLKRLERLDVPGRFPKDFPGISLIICKSSSRFGFFSSPSEIFDIVIFLNFMHISGQVGATKSTHYWNIENSVFL